MGSHVAVGRQSSVTVQYLKYPDTIHWRHEMTRLGRDEYGTWLGGPAGTIVQRGLEPAQAWQDPFVQLIPPTEWWSLIYNGDTTKDRIYVDITTPACWTGKHRVEMLDLDLDVVLTQDGVVEVRDREEFELHIKELRYPDELIARALATVDEVKEALASAREPFATAPRPWFQQVL